MTKEVNGRGAALARPNLVVVLGCLHWNSNIGQESGDPRVRPYSRIVMNTLPTDDLVT
jgi:hypothetical protein